MCVATHDPGLNPSISPTPGPHPFAARAGLRRDSLQPPHTYLPLLQVPPSTKIPAVSIRIDETPLDKGLWERARNEAASRGVSLIALIRLGVEKVLEEGVEAAELDRWDPAHARKAETRRAQRALDNLRKREKPAVVEGSRTTANSNVLRSDG